MPAAPLPLHPAIAGSGWAALGAATWDLAAAQDLPVSVVRVLGAALSPCPSGETTVVDNLAQRRSLIRYEKLHTLT